MRRFPSWALASLWFSWSGLHAGVVHARVSEDFSYSKQQTYSAALRFLRVDKGFDVVERDADAAYLIFSYPAPGQNGKVFQGTIEVIQVGDKVKLIVQLPKMPEYHEQMLADGLRTKLLREYGEAPARRPKEPAPKKSDSDRKSAPKKNQDGADGGHGDASND